MTITIYLLLLGFYFHLGWCWASVLEYLFSNKLTRKQWWLTVIIWPFSMIATDAMLEELDDY
ncbi:hypothetical protein [Buttiauxella noackiae]|uniref:hypothetical protein n=1 Tax=Buttiauxella noackiae TaxID=82992 RepID=UPI0028D5A142|nr:hypothetical protein [Buttiauxella noackiae]